MYSEELISLKNSIEALTYSLTETNQLLQTLLMSTQEPTNAQKAFEFKLPSKDEIL
ncbi:hypothetical protein [Acetivibrio ethanolgignens]|uniref:hypothetical protein n=1 Tax=Acetivibrio ethanolgignens TaxID=290052 RepID=UPI0012DEA1E9|nr:hypothetical protein [Acetivibrio ethanolgignens]